MDDQIKTAFEFARDTTKQLITLATGIIALEITFARDFAKAVDAGTRCYALISWLFLLFSVIFGIWTLMALTGTLGAKDKSVPVSIQGMNVRLPSILQIFTFLLGLGFTVFFGIKAN